MFLSYSIPVDFIINQQLHDRKVKKKGKNVSKFPPEFGIDIHIDDSAGVEMEGKNSDLKPSSFHRMKETGAVSF